MAADLLIDRTVIEASAAANAVQRLALLGIGQYLRASVIEQKQEELVGTIDLAGTARARKK